MNAPARTLDRLERLSPDTFAPLADDHADALTGGTAEAPKFTITVTMLGGPDCGVDILF